MSEKVEEKRDIALVTGGSRGIGAAIAKRLAREGFDIWLNYNSSVEAATAVKSLVERAGVNCTLLRFDVADEQAVVTSLETMIEENGAPFLFVHNAGIVNDVLLPMMKTEEWGRVIDVNLSSFFYISRIVTKAMLSKRRGRIIGITSVSGECGQAGQSNYSASKAGLLGAIKSLARELARRNILVNAVSPGLIDTDMTKDIPEEHILPLIPLGRPGLADDVAGAVAFLAGPDASYITGQVIRVNGGLYI